jgi:4-hydroxybenzoate polyprenyltransferase
MKLKEISDFLSHLRLKYNFFILSAPYLLGAVYNGVENINVFILNFMVVHTFLYGGVNSYNSYFDNDDGPIGGLEKPPKMNKKMYFLSWLIQFVGLIISFQLGLIYILLYILAMILSWLYSGPKFRCKVRPILGLIISSVGLCSVSTIMGFIAAGGESFSLNLILGTLGNSLIILSMYPFSQVYQIEEDKKKGDNTFTVRYGVEGVRRMFNLFFIPGIFMVSYSILFIPYVPVLFMIIGIFAYLFIRKNIKNLNGNISEYKKVMKTKYFGGLLFTIFVLALLSFT